VERFIQPKGEFTVVIAGLQRVEASEMPRGIEAELRCLRAKGMGAKEAARLVAEKTGLPKRKLYETLQRSG